MSHVQKVSGNILLFYAYDMGDDICLDTIRSKDLVPTYRAPQSIYFKDYHTPIAFRLVEKNNGDDAQERQDAVQNKIHHFGAVSFCYKIPFDDSLDSLKQKVISIKESYDAKSDLDAKEVFKKINPAIKKPHFYNIKNDYYAIHVNPIPGEISGDDFKDKYGSKIASLLRLETEVLSDYQQDDVLSSITGYYGQDLVIIDSEASFVYDDEYYQPLEFFESANIQQLELQYFDRVVDNKLNFFYQQEPHKIPLKAYLPLIGRRVELPATKLARLRVDISVITERLENSIKITGDAYFSNLYSMLVEKLSLRDWRDSINRKLSIIGDLYSVHQSHLDSIQEELLTVVIVVLIALELVLAIIGH